MRNERLDNLGTTAASLAATLHERRTLFDSAPQPTVLPAGAQALPIALLARVSADLRDEEWADVARQTRMISRPSSSGPIFISGRWKKSLGSPTCTSMKMIGTPGPIRCRSPSIQLRLIRPRPPTRPPR